ncbi:hypothetical protein RND59_00630 [Vibrio ruber]|uniref:hypothetical protein n=1 Tax=Vibrio ruber TaxID=184755 RepID=UPI00289323B7|nr:hypothetical protein [Vibrio ruber]WNJ95662.1 hypothetical protein RND59_00630 [Vibrio ruber]
MFSLKLGTVKIESEGEQILVGNIKIEDFSEDFHVPLSYWDRNEYLSQWTKGLEVIFSGGKKSAFITAMYNPTTANFIFWWIIYRVGNDVYIQNYVLFVDELKEPFDENNFIRYVPERETITEDGAPISEWKVNIDDIGQALLTIKSFEKNNE